MSAEFRTLLQRRAEVARLPLYAQLVEKLDQYFDLLVRWNTRINLTGFDLANLSPAIVDRLFIEPMAAARYLPVACSSFIDVGSGGGSPAIPLALSREGVRCVMVESRSRKSVFLAEAARMLGLDAEVLTKRYEEVAEDAAHHGLYDALTLRAVRTDPDALLQLRSLLRNSGVMLLFRRKEESVGELKDLLEEVGRHPLPGDAGSSELVLLRSSA